MNFVETSILQFSHLDYFLLFSECHFIFLIRITLTCTKEQAKKNYLGSQDNEKD